MVGWLCDAISCAVAVSCLHVQVPCHTCTISKSEAATGSFALPQRFLFLCRMEKHWHQEFDQDSRK